MFQSYTYSITGDTQNGKVRVDRLAAEIDAAELGQDLACDPDCGGDIDELVITFVDSISEPSLAAVVGAHGGEPLPAVPEDHNDLGNISTDDHHPQAHAHTHGDVTGRGEDDHHSRQHALTSASDHSGRAGLNQLPAGTEGKFLLRGAAEWEIEDYIGASVAVYDPDASGDSPNVFDSFTDARAALSGRNGPRILWYEPSGATVGNIPSGSHDLTGIQLASPFATDSQNLVLQISEGAQLTGLRWVTGRIILENKATSTVPIDDVASGDRFFFGAFAELKNTGNVEMIKIGAGITCLMNLQENVYFNDSTYEIVDLSSSTSRCYEILAGRSYIGTDEIRGVSGSTLRVHYLSSGADFLAQSNFSGTIVYTYYASELRTIFDDAAGHAHSGSGLNGTPISYNDLTDKPSSASVLKKQQFEKLAVSKTIPNQATFANSGFSFTYNKLEAGTVLEIHLSAAGDGAGNDKEMAMRVKVGSTPDYTRAGGTHTSDGEWWGVTMTDQISGLGSGNHTIEVQYYCNGAETTCNPTTGDVDHLHVSVKEY